jgi:hypothetical protein
MITGRPRDHLFQIMDGIIAQLNRTKEMFIIMVLTLMIVPPVAFAVTFALFGPPFLISSSKTGSSDGFGPPPQIVMVRIVPIIISLIFLGIGIRQWFLISK